jgi:hypothetical protein
MLGLRPGRFMPLAVVFGAALAQPSAEAQAPAPNYGPDVLVISEPVLAALDKGLRTEIALREALRKQLAALKTSEQYQQCQGAAATSPESMKLSESMMTMPDNIAPDEWRRRMMRAGKALEALILQKCGVDPSAFNDNWRAARLKEIEDKAASAAGPIP